MKLFSLILLSALSFANLSFAWHSHDLFPTFRGRSRVPNFVFDTQHPWIKDKQNLIKLWRLDDSKSALCDISSELRPSNTSTGFTYPADLFRTLNVDTKWLDNLRTDRNWRTTIGKSDWGYMTQQIHEILSCPAALQDVEELHVQTRISDVRDRVYSDWSGPPPPAVLPDLLVELLTSMPHLRKLEWSAFDGNNDMFEKAFVEANLTLPMVLHLLPALGTEFLIGMCPGVERIDYREPQHGWSTENLSSSTLSMLQSLESAGRLKSFSMEGLWKLSHVEVLLEKSPNLTNLSIQGFEWYPLGGYFDSMFNLEDARGRVLKEYTEVLAGFSHLEHLWLPPVWRLGLGFDGGPGCGNAYDGPDGRQYGRHVVRQSIEAAEMASSIVLAKIPRLKTLCMGGERPEIFSDDLGNANATWPWTGRVREYTFEIWPEKEDYPGEYAEYTERSLKYYGHVPVIEHF